MNKKNYTVLLTAIVISCLLPLNAFAYTASFKQVAKDSNGTATLDIRIKDNMTRIEAVSSGRKIITITNNNGIYNYLPDENIAVKFPLDQATKEKIINPVDYMQFIRDLNTDTSGTEEIDGKLCDIYEYVDKPTSSNVKVWIWKEKEFPVQMEFVDPSIGASLTVFLTDIEINQPIPDDIFDLPQGTKIEDMSEYPAVPASQNTPK
ncbi:MAG: hypothetical protein ABH883_03985 [Candidatus Omnitrophota bacterium]